MPKDTNSLRVAILTEAELARSHGTGAQILSIFQESLFHHFYFKITHGRSSEVSHSTLLEDPVPIIPQLHRPLRFVKRKIGISLWNGSKINVARFGRILGGIKLPFDVAYVVVACERDAAKALSVLSVLRIPYILHVMDLYDRSGLDPVRFPAFRSLVMGAKKVLALLPAISRELTKLGDVSVEHVPIGKPVPGWIAVHPRAKEAIKIVTSGRPYVGGCRFAANAWNRIVKINGMVEMTYIGSHYNDLPTELRPHCRDAGFIESEDLYQRHLASAHLAFLSGPDTLDHAGRFSFPSRAVDYLMAGLPVLARVAKASATEEVLAPLRGTGVAFVESESDIALAIRDLTSTVNRWRDASKTVRSFAVSTMSLEAVRTRIFLALQEAAESQNS